MPNIMLNPMLVTQAWGKAGSVQVSRTRAGALRLTQANIPRKKPPTDVDPIARMWWTNAPAAGHPGVVVLGKHVPECQAWKTADATYQLFTPEVRNLWRDLNTRPHTSAYDHYMRATMPHLLRGLPSNYNPQNNAIWKFNALDPVPFANILDPEGPMVATPPTPCLTWGIHYIESWTYLATWTAPPHTGETFYTSRLCTEAFSFYTDTAIHFQQTGYTRKNNINPPAAWSPWQHTGIPLWCGEVMEEPDDLLWVNTCPPLQHIGTGELDEDSPDVFRATAWLMPGIHARYHLWPETWPSRRGDLLDPASRDFAPEYEEEHAHLRRL